MLGRDHGRISLTPMVGLSVAGIALMPVWLFIYMGMAMGLANGGGVHTRMLSIVATSWIVSGIAGPAVAWVCWYRRQRRWTWWWITLPLQLFALFVVLLITGWIIT